VMTGVGLLLASLVASAVTKLGGPNSDMMRGTDGRDYLNDRSRTTIGSHSNERVVMRRTFVLLASLRANLGLGKPSALAILSPITIVTASLLAASVAGTANAKPTCEGSLQALVNTADPGTVVETAAGCVYRERVTINKPLTLKGGPGTEIRGSDVWTGWTNSGSYWVSKGSLPVFPAGDVFCNPREINTSRCKWPEQVFFDENPLLQVASNPQSGQFALNANRQVILADDPMGHTVEVSTRARWVQGASGDVTIEGFTMKHAANPGQAGGALSNNGYDNWTVRNNDLSWAHGVNLSLTNATGLAIIGNNVHHGGQFGITGSQADLEVLDNEIHHNNTEDFDPRWAAGGMKNAGSVRLVVNGNDVHHNDWSGLWCDQACNDATYSNNRVHHNLRYGIRVEISDHVKVFGNVVWENGWVAIHGLGYQQSGVSVLASRDVEVYSNTLAWNNDGVVVINEQRTKGVGGSDPKFDTVTDVHVHHNTILATDYPSDPSHYALAWVRSYDQGNLYAPLANNRGYDNMYWYAAPEGSETRYRWETDLSSLEAFNATLGEERGRYLSQAEMDEVVTTNNIPASPEHVVPPTRPAPKVISTVPEANATGVVPTTNVKATFSDGMLASSINTNTFKLFKKGSTTKIAAVVSYYKTSGGQLAHAILDPTNSLQRGVTYKAVVTTGAKDAADNSLDQDSSTPGLQPMTWLFTVSN
jgi:nitrous oxidase accessory protein NosD